MCSAEAWCMIHVFLSILLFGMLPRVDGGHTLDQLWNSDFMLPRVDGSHTWINYGIVTLCCPRSYLDQLWDSDFVLPREDGSHTWINYGIHSVLNFLWENWRKKASRWSVFSYSSPLLDRFVSIPWYVFLSSSILRGTSRSSWSPCPRFDPTPRTKPSITMFANVCPKTNY